MAEKKNSNGQTYGSNRPAHPFTIIPNPPKKIAPNPRKPRGS
jgi:hypothetical protein